MLVQLARWLGPARLPVGDLDDPRTTEAHAETIRAKGLLRAFYREVYGGFLAARSGLPPGLELEIGSGGGFFKELLPDVVTSDVMPIAGVDRVIDAGALPFAPGALAAVYAMDAFHHLPDASAFLAEVARCLAPGGRLVLFEPANTLWSRFVYRGFHHEPFEPGVAEWNLAPGGPLSMANGALPWIVFVRDRARLAREHPYLSIRSIRYDYPLAYLATGGVSRRQLLPDRAWAPLRALERLASPLVPWTGMFMRVVVQRI